MSTYNTIAIKKGTGTSCEGQLANKIFQTEFAVAGGVFLSYWNYQLRDLKRRRDSDSKNYFVNEKREISNIKHISKLSL